MSEDLEDLLRTMAVHVYERVKHQSFTDRIFEKEMSEELTEKEIKHEAHKKLYDERKGKYKFIDLWFPDHKIIVKIKARKYITRTELNELKDDELMTGMNGLLINFYNGVTIRHTDDGKVKSGDFDPLTSLSMPLDHHRHNKPSRMTLPQLSGSTGRLSDIGEPTFKSNKLPYRTPLTALPLNGDKEAYSNTNKIFSVSCVAFFLSEGNRKEFSIIFNDLLESMKFDKIDIPDKFLDGPSLKTPDGELAEILQKAFADRRRSKTRKEKSGKSSRNQSADEQESDLHYVGFNGTED